MLGSGFGAAQAVPASIQTFETTEQINLEVFNNILETQTIVEIATQDKLTFVATQEQVLVLDENEKLVAIIGEELKQTAERDDVKVIPVELAEVQQLTTDKDSRLVIVQEQVLTVVDTERIMTEQVPQIVELSVVDADAFWKTSALQLQDATITDAKDVIALTVDGKVHVFQALSAQAVEYQQIPTTIDLEKVIANPIAIDELNEVVALVDNRDQLVLIQTQELIQNSVEQVIVVPTESIPTQVEIATVDQEITKVIIVEDEWIEKISVDMTSETVVESEIIEMALTTIVDDVIVEEITIAPIAITLDQEKTLLVLTDDNRIAEYDHLTIELNQPTNEIVSIVKIVRDEVAPLSSCSVNIVDGTANYGQVTIGEIAETQFVLQTEGSPIVSVMGSEWTTIDGEIVMAAEQTHFELVTAELGEEPRLQIAYEEMTQLTTEPVSFGVVDDSQELELFLQLEIPTTYDRESLDAQQTVAVFAEC